MTSLLTNLFGSGRRASLDSQASEQHTASTGGGDADGARTSAVGSLGRPSLSEGRRTSIGHVPSFNDFSFGASDDVEDEVAQISAEGPCAVKGGAPAHDRPARTNVWQSTFAPGQNHNMRHSGSRDAYDHVDAAVRSPSVWAHIAKADAIKKASFNTFDANKDGFVDAQELRNQLGAGVDVEALIKQADKNGDGKIDYTEFCDILRDS